LQIIANVCKLKEKIKSTYHQVTQIETDKRPRLQKLQHMFKVKEIMETANEAMAEILAGKDLNMTEFTTSYTPQQRLLQKK
jgi:hypothetical protein